MGDPQPLMGVPRTMGASKDTLLNVSLFVKNIAYFCSLEVELSLVRVSSDPSDRVIAAESMAPKEI